MTALAICRLGSLIDVMRLMTCCGVDMRSLGATRQQRRPLFVRNAVQEEGTEADREAGQEIAEGGARVPDLAPRSLMKKRLASTSPISTASVRSNTTVMKNVVSRTMR